MSQLNLKDYLKPSNWKGFMQGNIRKFMDDTGWNTLSLLDKEQIIYRSLTCAPCLKNGECFHCGCMTPEKFYEDRACSNGKYPAMMGLQEWTTFKSTMGITPEVLKNTVVTVEDIPEFIATEGEVKRFTISLTNLGLNDLVITHTASSCGCTIPSYTSVPTAPGDIAKVDVSINTKGRAGKFLKSVQIRGNFDTITVSIKGKINKNEQVKQDNNSSGGITIGASIS